MTLSRNARQAGDTELTRARQTAIPSPAKITAVGIGTAPTPRRRNMSGNTRAAVQSPQIAALTQSNDPSVTTKPTTTLFEYPSVFSTAYSAVRSRTDSIIVF